MTPSDSLANLRYYLIWATRRRRPFLEGELLQRAADLMIEAADALGVRVTRVTSGGDYTIVTVEAPPDLAPATIVARLKRHSASHLRREFPELSTLPSIWTRQFLATSRDDFPPEEIERFVETQPRNERRRYPRPGELAGGSAASSRTGVEILRLPGPIALAVTDTPGSSRMLPVHDNGEAAN
jgi:putative transposase